MNKITRTPAPDVLRENYEAWGNEYKRRREANPAYRFNWKSYQGILVNQLILPDLRNLTQGHCAFCDGYPFDISKETIEHFRPKTRFPELVYHWENLFLACDACQSAKKESFDERLLKPDLEEYTFEQYFLLDYKTGEILVNTFSSSADQERAQITLLMYDLNHKERCKSRLHQYDYYCRIPAAERVLNDFPYRYFLA